ncbi:MAG: flagellar motor switch protein FliG [Alphaproteobacteria bacterium]|nr:flagellar motor switch protein FliG [Alphaproteobacteria bacterium]
MAVKQTIDNYNALTGPQKAAVFMMSLPEEYASKFFSLLEDEEVKEISVVMAGLGTVTSAVVEKLFIDFANEVSNPTGMTGNYENTERLLLKALPRDRVASIMDDIRGPAGKTIWDKLGNVHEQMLANFLKNEYPQTVALILSKIKPDHAAKVLALLDQNFAMNVVMRIIGMDSVQKEVLEQVEATLRREFMNNMAKTAKQDSHELVANIFNNLESQIQTNFLTDMEERNVEEAEKIKALMFTFNDLPRLDATSIQTLIRAIDDTEKLAIAMKGASDEIKELFFSNMSERKVKMLKEEIEALGPVRVRDVDEAQAYIIQTAKMLKDEGSIKIPDSSSGDEYIY